MSPHETAVKMVRQEVEQYRTALESKRTRYKIVDQSDEPDGSILLKIIKQYNATPVGDYLN